MRIGLALTLGKVSDPNLVRGYGRFNKEYQFSLLKLFAVLSMSHFV